MSNFLSNMGRLPVMCCLKWCLTVGGCCSHLLCVALNSNKTRIKVVLHVSVPCQLRVGMENCFAITNCCIIRRSIKRDYILFTNSVTIHDKKTKNLWYIFSFCFIEHILMLLLLWLLRRFFGVVVDAVVDAEVDNVQELFD